MATLEKIRSKSVLLLIIIAVALLAFILGDFLTSQRTFFGTGTTIAKVGSQKVDVIDFQSRVGQASQSNQQQDAAVLQQQVLDQMITEKLLEQECKQLGLTVTDAELTDYLLGENNQAFEAYVQRQLGIESAATFYDMWKNPAKYQIDRATAEKIKQTWVDMEQEANKQLLYEKFITLYAGTLQPNKLDTKALYDESNRTSTIAFTRKDYSSLKDDDYEVKSADINKEYNQRKGHYAVKEETRDVYYINVPIVPSSADLQAGRDLVQKALQGLRTEPGTEGLAGMSEFVAKTERVTLDGLKDKQLKTWLESNSVDSAGIYHQVPQNYEYKLAKILGTESAIEKVTVDYLVLEAPRAEIAEIVNKLNNGELTYAAAAMLPAVEGRAAEGEEINLLQSQVSELRPTLLEAQTGRWFTPDTVADRGRIFRVTEKGAPVRVYDVALIDYTVEPSNATVSDLEMKLSRYVKENTTTAAFEKNAAENGYSVLDATVTPSTPRLGQLPDSHSMVAWAMEAKKGQVSPVFGNESTKRFTAVALDNVYKGYTPADNKTVHQELERRVRNHAKAESIHKQAEGATKTVAAHAQKLGTSVDTTTVVFANMFIPRVGANEGLFAGRVAASKKGEFNAVDGNNGVVYYEVIDVVEPNEEAYNEADYRNRFVSTKVPGAQKLDKVLRGNKTIKNNTLNFYK